MSEQTLSQGLSVTFTASGPADEYVVKVEVEALAFTCQLAVYGGEALLEYLSSCCGVYPLADHGRECWVCNRCRTPLQDSQVYPTGLIMEWAGLGDTELEWLVGYASARTDPLRGVILGQTLFERLDELWATVREGALEPSTFRADSQVACRSASGERLL